MKKWLLYSGLLVVNSLVLSINCLHAFSAPGPSIDSLNQLAVVDTLSLYERINISEKAFSLADQQGYQRGQYKAALIAGMSHMGLNQLEAAITYFKAAYDLGESMEDPAAIAEANFHVGEVYYYLENYTQAKAAFTEALEQFQQLDSARWIGVIKNGLGVILYAEGNKEEGAKLYEEAFDILSNNDYEVESQGPLNNLADHYFHEDKIELAQQYFEKVLATDRKNNSSYGETLSLLNLAWCYRKKRNYDQAINFIEESLSISLEKGINQHLILAHSELSKTYEEINDYEKALYHSQKYIQIKDSLGNAQSEARINDLMVQFETEKKEKQLALSRGKVQVLESQKKIQRLTNFLLLGAACLSVVVAFLFISRNKVKQRLAKIELENQKLESERLQQQLNSKKQDLTNLALDISRKNNFSDQVHHSLQEINRISVPFERKKKIEALLKLTSSHLRINEDAQEFQVNIETVNNDFFNKLDHQFPGLTANDKTLCGLIRLNLSSKDIASIKNISPKSVEMGRYRLRKKLSLNSEEDLSDFLQNFK